MECVLNLFVDALETLNHTVLQNDEFHFCTSNIVNLLGQTMIILTNMTIKYDILFGIFIQDNELLDI